MIAGVLVASALALASSDPDQGAAPSAPAAPESDQAELVVYRLGRLPGFIASIYIDKNKVALLPYGYNCSYTSFRVAPGNHKIALSYEAPITAFIPKWPSVSDKYTFDDAVEGGKTSYYLAQCTQEIGSCKIRFGRLAAKIDNPGCLYRDPLIQKPKSPEG
jgi:hypothetical protein